MNEEILFAREDEINPNNPLPADDTVDSQKYLIFMADDLKMGVVAEDVVEILTNQPITYLPMLPEFIRGINMRHILLADRIIIPWKYPCVGSNAVQVL